MKEIYKDVFLIEEFITKEEQDYLFSIINNTSEDIWLQTHTGHIVGKHPDDAESAQKALENRNTFWDDKVLNIPDEEFWQMLTERVNKFFDYKYDINPMSVIQRQQPGTILAVHFDQGDNPDLEKAVIIYLNDDFNGGELFFPEHNFQIKPPARSMIMFPGTEDYMHGVKDILPGPIRYVLPSFGFKKKGSIDAY